MEAIDLKKLKPQEAEIKIGDKIFKLRPINLKDWIWMQKRFGQQLQKKLEAMPFHELCVIIYRLLDKAGKEHFQARDDEDFDDDGEPAKTRVSGPEVMACEMQGLAAMAEIVDAFKKAMGIDPETEKRMEAAEKNGR